MWRLLALSPWRVLVAVAWGVVALGSGLALAALAAWLIARAWQMPPVLDLSVAVVAVRALGISRGLCRYLERLATHDVALRAMTTARTTVYRALARSDIWWWSDRRGSQPAESATGPGVGSGVTGRAAEVRGVGQGAADRAGDTAGGRPGSAGALRRGDVLVRIGADIDDLGAVVVRAFVPIAVAVVLSLAAVGLIAIISVSAAVILAVALGVSGVLAPWLSAVAARDAERAVRRDRADFTAESLTVLDHAAELRVAGRLDAALAEADKAARRAVAAEDSAASRSAWAAAATPLSIGISTFGALLVGIAAYGPTGGLPGGMSPMALTILVLVPLSAFEAVGALPAAATTLTTARAALHRLRTASPPEDLPEAPGEPAGKGTPDGRAAVFPSAAPAGLIPMPRGRRIAVVGPSGAGKTTLLMSWAGLFDTPRDGVTFFAEDAHLFGTSILENLRVARGDLTADGAEDALRAVGLGAWLDTLPDGVHTALTAGAAAVSGGQRRRLLLARALVAPAGTLLLDEPTEHLDAAEGAQLLRNLLDRDSGLVDPGRTVVVVTHQLPVGHRADTVVTVDATGRAEALGAAGVHEQ
ncbi:thiol reductant ABC exporter subunit CydC [Nocardia halotolerans]|uniref:Thiol reductant ABC exporter subunit CydC n=1 Tax=Nocardia halotolerans TaxID=1755878 RepID=A0ABV8VP85_9NOCA